MVEISEGKLKFTFPNNWNAIKYDEAHWHTRKMKSQLKAMDILASKDDHHWWIEIKDCIGFETDNMPRLSPQEPEEVGETRIWIKQKGWKPLVSANRKKPFIVDEITEKFRDTLFALACAQRTSEPEMAAYEVVETDKSLVVVLLLTWESREFKRLAIRLQDKLRTAFTPYAVEAYVTNETISAVTGLECQVTRVNP
jgi:hypothetical protein